MKEFKSIKDLENYCIVTDLNKTLQEWSTQRNTPKIFRTIPKKINPKCDIKEMKEEIGRIYLKNAGYTALKGVDTYKIWRELHEISKMKEISKSHKDYLKVTNEDIRDGVNRSRSNELKNFIISNGYENEYVMSPLASTLRKNIKHRDTLLSPR
jgi:hypothetical protein